MAMTSYTDGEVLNFGREWEQPASRFGSEHTVRDEVPAIHPEIIDFMERQDDMEKEFLATQTLELRKGQIAVRDTVQVPHHNGSAYL